MGPKKKYTPGPWVATLSPHMISIGRMVYPVPEPGDPEPPKNLNVHPLDEMGAMDTSIAGIWCPDHDVNRELCETNGRLMAAAPEMHQELEKTVESVNKMFTMLPDEENNNYDPGQIIMDMRTELWKLSGRINKLLHELGVEP